MRIGITGANGVLGRRIVQILTQKRHEIVSFGGDVRNLSALESWAKGLDTIIHAAAVVPIQAVEADPAAAISVNVGGGANVAKAAQESQCRLVYISTSHVYQSRNEAVSEDSEVSPISLYGLSKLQGEQWVQKLAPGALVLRIFSFFDERQPTSYLVPALRSRVLASTIGAELVLEGAENIRDIASAEWIASACTQLIDSDAAGIFNIGTGKPKSVLQIAETVASVFERADIQWRITQSAPANSLVADISKLSLHLGKLPAFNLRSALLNWSDTPE